MTRNLLPRLRTNPTPANVSVGAVGQWSTIANPGELAKIEYKSGDQDELRTRIQSIPSPWARMLLFRAALDDPGHPARILVENEILDALEFAWSLSRLPGVSLDYQRVDLLHLSDLGERTGSRRAQDFAEALIELAPRKGSRHDEAEFRSVTLATLEGRPIFASSPYTLLFTAEDARDFAGIAGFFEYTRGKPRRRLCERPVAFQEYVARVMLPQLYSAAPGQPGTAGPLQARMRTWLEGELSRCEEAAPTQELRNRVARPAEPGELDWRAAAGQLGLDLVEGQPFGEISLFKQRLGTELAHSPLLLRSSRPVEQAPLVVTPDHFDGFFFQGAPRTTLPPEFHDRSRETLPGLDIQYPWVSPAHDWFVDRLVLLSEPIDRTAVQGYEGYRWRGTADDPRFSEPHLLLPLRAEFFRYFKAEDVDEMLTIEAHADGRIGVSLAVPIGDGERILIQRTYHVGDVLNEHGPAFSLWPSFRSDQWKDYVLFRRDAAQTVSQQFGTFAYADGKPLPPSGEVRRTPLVAISTFESAPDVLELRSVFESTGAGSKPVGVLLPRYKIPAVRGPETWEVGVDFGTSNTVVSVRKGAAGTPEIFGAADLALSLTEPSETTLHLIDAYFFPAALAAQPFGTAVVHHETLSSYDLAGEPLGLRVNVPFSGDVDGYTTNRVEGDLKWSADQRSHFLSASFLRHVLSAVVARAIMRGVDPANISFRWAYPRAFSPSQLNKLRAHWEVVLRSFQATGVSPAALLEELDESQSVLRHFFNANIVQPAGGTKIIVDVGGGTSDIAMYGRGKVLALDSVLLGGRNLTGARPQNGGGAGNPFVERFSDWAREHQLPEENLKAVEAYLAREQVHLAFSYLVGTRWFAEKGASLFSGNDVFQRFQLLVFYFFGALFHYLGLSLRTLPNESEGVTLPGTVLLAGNGSRYMHWLTDLVPRPAEDLFAQALGGILASAAEVDATDYLPRVQVSDRPKEEVARGLVARVGPGDLPATGALTTPVVGEHVTLHLGDGGEARAFTPESRFDSRDVIETAHAREAEWSKDRLEIELFHEQLVRAAERVTSYGEQWSQAPNCYRSLFEAISSSRIRDLTAGRLQYLAELENGFRGSLFLLEATVVLEEMRDRLFTP